MIQEFILYLKASGFDIERHPAEGYPLSIGARWVAKALNATALVIYDTEEEQPEVLLWCLKELERLGLAFHISNLNEGEYLVVGVKRYMSRSSASGKGPTMTAAAIQAVCSLPKGAPDA